MNIKLLPNRILVEPVEEEKAGVQIVEAIKSGDARGRVVMLTDWTDISVGSGGSVELSLYGIKKDSIIHFVKGVGEELEYEGKKYRVLYVSADRESEVLAIEK